MLGIYVKLENWVFSIGSRREDRFLLNGRSGYVLADIYLLLLLYIGYNYKLNDA
jgi:hypothetical protein